MMTPIVKFTWREVADDYPDLSWLEQDCWNEPTDTEPAGYGNRRIASYGDEWWMVGVVVDADVWFRGRRYGTRASRWGIESDSHDGYTREVADELRDELRRELRDALGDEVGGIADATDFS